MNSTLNFGIPPVLVFQLEVYYKVDRLLIGLTAQQKGTTARWYSNKTSLCISSLICQCTCMLQYEELNCIVFALSVSLAMFPMSQFSISSARGPGPGYVISLTGTSSFLAKCLARDGLTPTGSPVTSSLPVTNKKLLKLMPARRTPVGAN